MIYTYIISFLCVTALLMIQIFKRDFFIKNIKIFFIVSILIAFILSIIFSVITYINWRNDELMRFALQIENGYFAFFFTVFMRFFASHIIALIFMGVLVIAMHYLNKRFDEKFFEKEEVLMAFIAGFFAGFPGVLFFILMLIIVYFIAHIINAIRKKSLEREVISLYYFWLPVSIFVIIVSAMWLHNFTFWQLLSV